MRFRGLATGVAAAAALLLVAAGPATAGPFQRGIVLTGWKSGTYLTERSDRLIRRAAEDGSSDFAVFSQWFMDRPESSSIAPDPARTPTDAAVLHAAAVARAAGMRVTIKPQIGIKSGSWIGGARPADLEAFWSDYRKMLLHYADLASKAEASMLVIGTEMRTLSGDAARWRALIANVRERFAGDLTYAANFDEFEAVRFWHALDYVGIDAYFSLADTANPAPGAAALAAAWKSRGYLRRIAAVAARSGKRVLFTEIGYRGIQSTAVEPNRWQGVGLTDQAAQADAYRAFYEAVAVQPWMAGVYWWEINADKWWVQDYSPVGKLAEQVMVDWNRAAVAADAAPPPAQGQPPASAEPPAQGQPPVSPEPPAQPEPPGLHEPPVEAEPPTAPRPAAPPQAPSPNTDAAAGGAHHAPSPPRPADHPAPTGVAALAGLRPRIAVATTRGRLAGGVTPYLCAGRVSLRLRKRAQGRWRHVRSPKPLSPDAAGRFARRLPRGTSKVRAVFSSPCGSAASAWVSTRR